MDLNNLPPVVKIKTTPTIKKRINRIEVAVYVTMFTTGILFGTIIVLMLASIVPSIANIANL